MPRERRDRAEQDGADQGGGETGRLRQPQLLHRIGRDVEDQVVRAVGDDRGADRQDHRDRMIPQQVAYRCLGRLDLLEFRRLGHAAADVEADRPEQEAEEERHPPAPGQKLRLGQGAGQHNTEDRGNDGGQPLARPLPAGEKAFAGLGMLDQEGGGAAELAADREALQ